MREEGEEETLWQAFAPLPGRYQILLRLLFANPAPSYQEISAVTGMPVGSIGPVRRRCLAQLREYCLERQQASGATHLIGMCQRL